MLPTPTRHELVRRMPRLIVGLVLFGFGVAIMVIANLGLSPWEVLHQGISRRTGITIGTISVITAIIIIKLCKEAFQIIDRFILPVVRRKLLKKIVGQILFIPQ